MHARFGVHRVHSVGVAQCNSPFIDNYVPILCTHPFRRAHVAQPIHKNPGVPFRNLPLPFTSRLVQHAHARSARAGIRCFQYAIIPYMELQEFPARVAGGVKRGGGEMNDAAVIVAAVAAFPGENIMSGEQGLKGE